MASFELEVFSTMTDAQNDSMKSRAHFHMIADRIYIRSLTL
jgi:hypothetical protein